MLTVDFDRLGIVGGDTVLDLGSGPGRHSFEVQRRGATPIAVDLDRSALGMAAGMMSVVSEQEDVPSGSCAVGDALALPFCDDSFDRIIASEVLEHIPSDSEAMQEITRVLKPGGTVAISVPRFWPEGICWGLSKDYRTSEGGHVRIYRRSQLLERLSSCGLKPYSTHHAHALHSPYWWLRCALGLDGKGALPRSYHRFLVWDIENPNSVIRAVEKGLDPLLGKSLVVYLQKDHAAATAAPVPGRLAAQTCSGVTWMREVDRDLTTTAAAVAAIQDADGAIPWERNRHVDPWNHVEAAMGLDAAGYHHSAETAYLWLADTQRSDGAWPAATSAGVVVDATLDANFCAYLAAGCWHHFMLTSDDAFLRALWPVVERAIDFVLDLQMLSGAIAWARDAAYRPWPEALLTSSSSIHHSLWCAITVAERVGEDRPDWELSLAGLTAAIRQGDDGFKPKPTYAMDWYYPVLGGAVRGASALERLQRRWEEFVIEGRGVLCTDDKPWVTTGETCELVIACTSLGLEAQAHELFDWVQHLRDGDGLYWTGANHPSGAVWPLEKTTWSAGSVLMAADCLQGGLTRDLFTGSALVPLPAPSLLPEDPPIGAPREGFAR